MRIDKNMMRRIVAIGLPSALQQSIVAFSNIFVQSYINGFGATVIAGFAAEGKIEIFVVLPIVALSTAVTTFVSQNLGAGEEKRARRGVFVAMLISLVTSIIVIGAVLASFGLLVRAFTGDPEVIKAAWFFAFCFIPGQLFFAVLYTFQSALRGARNVKFSVICSVGCFVVFRQIYLAFVRQINYDLFWIAFGYPLAWGLCTVLVTIYFFSKNHITAGDMTRIHIQHTNTANGDFLSFCKRMDDFQNQYVPGRKETGMNSIYNAENLKDIFLMYDDKKPIGTACLWQHDAETCEVLRMFIDDKYRGQAHGAKLISEVENYARTLGYKHIIMRTFKTLPGVDIFDKHGFKIVDQDNFTHIDRFQNAATIAPYRVYMNKDL
jgi:N-acetylglutamate synthase-like GNAT family acetyltransferase